MLERNKHNGFSTVIFKTCYSKNALKGAFLQFTVFPHGDFKSLCNQKTALHRRLLVVRHQGLEPGTP